MLRWINGLLLVLGVIGGVLAWRESRTGAELTRDFRRLSGLAGYVPVDDETQFHVVALETAEPLDFAWSVYLPAAKHVRWELVLDGSNASGTSLVTEAQRGTVRLRFRKVDGGWQVWNRYPGGSSFQSGLGAEWDALLDHPEQLRRDQAGMDRNVVTDGSEILTLLEIAPPGISAEADGDRRIRFQMGTEQAWQRAQEDAPDE